MLLVQLQLRLATQQCQKTIDATSLSATNVQDSGQAFGQGLLGIGLTAAPFAKGILPPKCGTAAANTGAGAENVVNGVRLRAQLTGEEIAGGHAFDKHVVELGEFPGVANRSQFAGVIEDVVTNGEMRTLSGGRTGYWKNGTVVIRNPGAVDGGTAFRPRDGYDYFLNTLH
ncbi:hypothetical protein ACVXZ4_12950 [Lacisediminihabitans sp. FW035]